MAEATEKSFGEALRLAREQTGLGIKELAETTRVQSRYLEALEAEAWDVVPRGVIGRGFVRIVAREVGVPAEKLLALYREARGVEDDETAPPLPESDWKVDTREDHRWRSVVFALVFLVSAAVGIWIWSPWSVPSRRATPPAVPETAEPSVPSPGLDAEQPEIQDTSATAAEPAATALEAEPAVQTEQVEPAVAALDGRPPAAEDAAQGPTAAVPPKKQLEVQAVEKAWVQVKADGGKPQARLFSAGERLTYEAEEEFVVRLGNAGGVRLYWNGETLKAPGKPGQVMTLSFPEALETLRP